MISFTADPPALFEVKRSYATSATTEEVLCDQVHVAFARKGQNYLYCIRQVPTGIDEMAESCLLIPLFTLMLVKLLTPLPPIVV